MMRFARRIFADDFGSWLPAIITITLVTALIGVTVSQFAWTHNAVFVNAVTAAGHDVMEFRIVSETIYLIVAPLAVLSLSIVGTATVDATRSTFAKWRLIGASPSDIRRSIWALVAIAAGIGTTAGSILAVPASSLLIPWFNQMAVADFTAPRFQPAPMAWLLAFFFGFITCMGGAFLPSLRAAKVGPVEAMRQRAQTRRRWWWRIGLAAVFLVGGGALTVLGRFVDDRTAGLPVLFNLAMNAGMMAVFATYLLGAPVASWLLRVFARIASGCGRANAVTAACSARERAATGASALAPLAAGIGGAGVMIAAIQMSAAVNRAAGFTGQTNMTDTLVLVAIIAFVCLITSAAVFALSGRGTNYEVALLRSAGMSRRSVHRWFGWQAVALALVAVLLAVVPITLTILTGVAGSRALAGTTIIEVPWAVLAIGFTLSAQVIYAVFAIPARASLRASIADSLRTAPE